MDRKQPASMKPEEPDYNSKIAGKIGGDPAAQPSGEAAGEGNKLVRLIKSIAVNPARGKSVDDAVVKFKYYNAFNYSLLNREHENVNLTVGITSPKPGEGKTLVACNLAVSLALGSQKETVLVDLNVGTPRLHDVFRVPRSPGLTDSFLSGQIQISRTAVDKLSVLTSGSPLPFAQERPVAPGAAHPAGWIDTQPSLGLDQLSGFRDVIYSLEQEYEFVIVDMPSINNESVPVLFANQLNGVIVVVDSGRTKKQEIDAMFHQLNERQVLGFVLNRFDEQT